MIVPITAGSSAAAVNLRGTPGDASFGSGPPELTLASAASATPGGTGERLRDEPIDAAVGGYGPTHLFLPATPMAEI